MPSFIRQVIKKVTYDDFFFSLEILPMPLIIE